MKFSNRVSHDARPNVLAELLAAKRRSGATILDLTESNPTQAGIEYPRGFLAALSGEAVLRYEPEPFGLRSARTLIAREYGAPVDHVILTASTSEAYSWIFKLLCNPGDEVLIPRPSYPLFDYLAALESVVVRPYHLFYDHGWFIDFYTVRRAITDRTRALVLVNPNNPTGHFIRRHELEELTEICEHYDIALVSDEVFSGYLLHPSPDSVTTLRGIADFALNGLSKLAGLPQMKLAWMIAKRPMPELEIIADTFLSLGTPVQAALGELLELRGTVEPQILKRARANLDRLERKLLVEAGWYAIVPAPDGDETAIRLLRDHNILVQPGYFYDLDHPSSIVVSLLTPPEILESALPFLFQCPE